jgi:hypothetical protein
MSLFSSPQQPWMEITPGLFIKKFGKVWHRIHEQHLATTRIGPVLSSPIMERFYKQSFSSENNNNNDQKTLSSARWA